MKDRFGANRNGDIEFIPDIHAEKSRSRDADNFNWMAGQVQHASNCILRAPKMIAPKTVAQNDGAAAAAFIIASRKQTPRRRTYAERAEVVRADVEPINQM